MGKVELNATEIQVVKLVCKQMAAREIGDKLGLSFRTVESYKLNIQKKIKARNIVGIALWAVKNDIVKLR
jgi:DNA-binding CsgD family transcriptional regulator